EIGIAAYVQSVVFQTQHICTALGDDMQNMFQIMIRAHAVFHADDLRAIKHVRLAPRPPGVTDTVTTATNANACLLEPSDRWYRGRRCAGGQDGNIKDSELFHQLTDTQIVVHAKRESVTDRYLAFHAVGTDTLKNKSHRESTKITR